MYLDIYPNRTKSWRLEHWFAGREKRVNLGTYLLLILAEARIKRSEAKKLLSEGGDPNQQKKDIKVAKIMVVSNSFELNGINIRNPRSLRAMQITFLST